MILNLTTYAQTPTTLAIADGTSSSPYALIADSVDWGNAKYEHSYGSPRGTQGARPAAGIPQNRTVTLPLRVYGTSKDNLGTNLRALSSAIDELRRFGGQLSWQSAGQTYRQTLEVLGTDGATLGAWNNRAEQKSIAQVDVQLQCAPYAKGDPLDINDQTFSALASDYTIDAGTLANLTTASGSIKATAGTTTEYRLIQTGRGYDLGDTEVTIKATYQQTDAYKAGAVFWRSNSANYWTAQITDTAGASILTIQQITAGTATQRAITTLGTRLATGATLYVTARAEGTTITAEHWTSAPSPFGTPAATATYTTGTAQTGKAGLAFTPQSTTAEIDSLVVRPYTYARRSLPTKITMQGAIPGDAPALAQLELTTRQALPWALFSWQNTPSATTLTGTPTPRAAFTVLNGNDDVAASRQGWTYADATTASIQTPLLQTASATFSATTYTFTTPNDHGIPIGAQVLVAGVTPTDYNGTFTVLTTPTTKTLTVTGLTTPASNSTVSGTIVAGARSTNTYQAQYALDPSLLVTDAYADGDRAVEAWALVKTDSSSKLQTPIIITSLQAAAGGGITRYTDEWGSTGRPLPVASVAATAPVYRWTRLGTIHIPAAGARELRLVITATVGTSSAGGQFGIARVFLNPVRQRATLPTGRAGDSTYPTWSSTTTETVKTSDSDLTTSSYQPATTAIGLGDRSLGGTLLELLPGTTDLLVAASAIVPDDPTATTATEYLGATIPPTATSQAAGTVHVAITPRYSQLRS
jgi:hypothetical protein